MLQTVSLLLIPFALLNWRFVKKRVVITTGIQIFVTSWSSGVLSKQMQLNASGSVSLRVAQ